MKGKRTSIKEKERVQKDERNTRKVKDIKRETETRERECMTQIEREKERIQGCSRMSGKKERQRGRGISIKGETAALPEHLTPPGVWECLSPTL